MITPRLHASDESEGVIHIEKKYMTEIVNINHIRQKDAANIYMNEQPRTYYK
ncbi:hypothetical protein [Bartonella schoenbuchensis]|uniref:hypothetical protein n=1 Tax=Bartonella schoenbuchensis TaxID=165694 RepID=UPI001ABB306A|nr:hypothetical protein [Bartonella schoenbuchensis]